MHVRWCIWTACTAHLYMPHVCLHHRKTILLYQALHQADSLIVGCHLSFQVADVVVKIARACTTNLV